MPTTNTNSRPHENNASHALVGTYSQNRAINPIEPIIRHFGDTEHGWDTHLLNLPACIDTAVLDRQTKKVPETPNERALDAIAKQLAKDGYRVRLKMPRSGQPYLMIGDKIVACLKWAIDTYAPNEQPESYTEQEYYFDEACMEISVSGVIVESTMCLENFYAKLREIKTLNGKI